MFKKTVNFEKYDLTDLFQLIMIYSFDTFDLQITNRVMLEVASNIGKFSLKQSQKILIKMLNFGYYHGVLCFSVVKHLNYLLLKNETDNTIFAIIELLLQLNLNFSKYIIYSNDPKTKFKQEILYFYYGVDFTIHDTYIPSSDDDQIHLAYY